MEYYSIKDSNWLWGLGWKGWLNGTQSHLDFLPESHTDFIIAVLAEEFGFLGVFLLLFIYSLIIIRGTVIAVSASTTYGRLVAGSITLTFLYMLLSIWAWFLECCLL